MVHRDGFPQKYSPSRDRDDGRQVGKYAGSGSFYFGQGVVGRQRCDERGHHSQVENRHDKRAAGERREHLAERPRVRMIGDRSGQKNGESGSEHEMRNFRRAESLQKRPGHHAVSGNGQTRHEQQENARHVRQSDAASLHRKNEYDTEYRQEDRQLLHGGRRFLQKYRGQQHRDDRREGEQNASFGRGGMLQPIRLEGEKA